MSDERYVGTANSSSASTDELSDRFQTDQAINEISTATVVRIKRAPYDKDGNAITPGTPGVIGFIDVEPLVNQLDGKGNPTEHGVVYRLKYYRYQGGYGAFISDPKVGDIGKMVVADTDTSVVRETNDRANPGSRRRFDKADGTYFGTTQDKTAPTQYFAWKQKGFELKDEYGRSIKSEAGQLTIDGGGQSVVINGATITSSGNVITASGKSLDTHVHGGVTTGGSNTGPPA